MNRSFSALALRRCIEILGSQRAVAAVVGVKQPSVNYALNKSGLVPAEWCIPLESATGGAVTRQDLRPDIYLHAPAPRRRKAKEAA